VSAGDAAELDAGFHIVFQQCELQHGVLYLTHPAGELVGTACHILQESDKLLCLLVPRMIGDVKDVAGFQMLVIQKNIMKYQKKLLNLEFSLYQIIMEQ
jgi:hypothetical protein